MTGPLERVVPVWMCLFHPEGANAIARLGWDRRGHPQQPVQSRRLWLNSVAVDLHGFHATGEPPVLPEGLAPVGAICRASGGWQMSPAPLAQTGSS